MEKTNDYMNIIFEYRLKRQKIIFNIYNKMEDIFQYFASKNGIDLKSVMFFYYGDKIADDDYNKTLSERVNINDRKKKEMVIMVTNVDPGKCPCKCNKKNAIIISTIIFVIGIVLALILIFCLKKNNGDDDDITLIDFQTDKFTNKNEETNIIGKTDKIQESENIQETDEIEEMNNIKETDTIIQTNKNEETDKIEKTNKIINFSNSRRSRN